MDVSVSLCRIIFLELIGENRVANSHIVIIRKLRVNNVFFPYNFQIQSFDLVQIQRILPCVIQRY